MDMLSRNQYLKRLQEEYRSTVLKKPKGLLLDEAMKRTKLSRKHLIVKLSFRSDLKRPPPRKKRGVYYDGQVVAALIRIWKIFDYPCGQRLKPMISLELERLRRLKEIPCPDKTALKLKQISPAMIDIKLRREKELLNLRRNRHPSIHPLLYHKIPVKMAKDMDKLKPGACQLDFVAHCGASAYGDFIHTLSLVDVYSGWWEACGLMTRSQQATNKALTVMKERSPFPIKEIHPDNDSALINQLVWRWTQENVVEFSRSRPYKKNDNAYIEQKNWTHIRKVFGYERYDTQEELNIMNKLYENQLRLYKNFFQPIMRLADKERLGSKIKRKYAVAKTPYQRLMESDAINDSIKQKLKAVYHSLNPAQLKREINNVLIQLRQTHENKRKSLNKKHYTRGKNPPVSVRKYIIQPSPLQKLSVR